MYKFELTPEELVEVSEWSAEQDAIIVERQRARGDQSDTPYYGASGGSLTYMFTPTSLGLVIKVEHGLTKNVLDLTDYESW